ncbi:hypothetical protein M0805_008589 [Coniferiporia weirii]|nr:hypothetical protein M0805_008589 [Coniferiporia weirii]
MGGKAFTELDNGLFPRIPTHIYNPLKERLGAQLKTLYAFVGTPAEAPQKADHGDVDFVVCDPLTVEASAAAGATDSGPYDILLAHADALLRAKSLLGAEHITLVEGHRTSNFAIPAGAELSADWEGKFFQVDVHVCKDRAEWDRLLFFHSYGDLGMILGLLARAHGLTLGVKGLRTHYAQPSEARISSFPLSESLREILAFLGLSLDTWEQGFATREEIFAWVTSSRLFVPRRLTVAYPAQEKRAARQQRAMYDAFLRYSHALAVAESGSDLSRSGSETEVDEEPVKGKDNIKNGDENEIAEKLVKLDISENGEIGVDYRDTIGNKKTKRSSRTAIRQEALIYFGKKDAYDALVAASQRKRILREKFNGTKVTAWTGVQGTAVRTIMHGVREKLRDVDIAAIDEDALRKIVLDVQVELNHTSRV